MKAYIERIFSRTGFQKVFKNGLWLSSDRVLRLLFSLVVGALLARYLAPDLYGAFNYAYSFVGLVAVFATLGLDSIVIRELVNSPERRQDILGTAFLLKFTGAFIVVGVSVTAIFLLRPHDPQEVFLVFLVALAYIFQSFNVIDFFFQSRLSSKFAVISHMSAFIVCALAKLAAIAMKASLPVFVILGGVEVFLASAGLIFFYHKQGMDVRKWRFQWELAVKLLKDSWPLIFSGIAIMIYMRIDQVMVGSMLGNRELGIYSAAIKVSELWYFIPIAVVSSVFPKLIEVKKRSAEEYALRLEQMFCVMSVIGYSVGFFICFMSGHIISAFFGQEYILAKDILSVHIWAGLFVALGIARGNWLIGENLTRYQFITTVIGAVMNIILNIFFIKWYGAIGSAWATLIAQVFVGYLSTLFIDRKVFLIETRALFFNWRSLRHL